MSSWDQKTFGLIPNATCRMTVYIKGQDIVFDPADPYIPVGANFSLIGFEGCSPTLLVGTFDWTAVSLTFVAPADGMITLGCRLGGESSSVTGKAWFDDITLTQVK
jgi:hypothetical protein